MTPMFVGVTGTTLLWTGTIERVENSVGYGDARSEIDPNIKTFDMPVNPDYGIGPVVEFYSTVNAPESNYDHLAILRRDDRCIVYMMNEDDEGFEILGTQEFYKDSH